MRILIAFESDLRLRHLIRVYQRMHGERTPHQKHTQYIIIITRNCQVYHILLSLAFLFLVNCSILDIFHMEIKCIITLKAHYAKLMQRSELFEKVTSTKEVKDYLSYTKRRSCFFQLQAPPHLIHHQKRNRIG